jgi:hypothetical protein
MMIVDMLGQLTAGLRLALVLFAAMALTARVRGAWALLSASVIAYSPAHAAWLLGHPAPRIVSTAMDSVATSLACAAFIWRLATSAIERGLSMPRVRRGVYVNIAVALLVVGAAWLTR